MESRRIERAVALVGTGVALSLGATACAENKPIVAPKNAIELGMINSNGDVGFLFRGDDREDVRGVDCGGAGRSVRVKQNGDTVVVCYSASDKDLVIR